ncbi:VanZ family protein [Paenibacillus sp. JNUCC31]|uniref:VanZ family protein n=1 Tax=Paenibacillus sp. JNUCC-31 TaxID=2777983 RepID=UPI00177F7422|nr:VanZ family protein [Paenibacillus sp. JNUCC-31]QOS76793.1 VanZ family protein [Paenibacillus sp. JNUCC-31]
MKPKGLNIKIVWVAALIIYLYLLTKLILFKWHTMDWDFVWIQLMTIAQQPELIHTRTVNLTPFQEILRDWHSLTLHRPGTTIHLLGNVMAFIPLGIFIPVLMGNKLLSGAKVLVLSLLLSFAFEVTQLLTGMGIFDVDDLMLNTFGGMIGYVLYTMLIGIKRLIVGGTTPAAKKEYNSNQSRV